MNIKINKWFKFETGNGDSINITYDEAEELYAELHREFGYNAEKFWEANIGLSEEVTSSINKPEESYTFNTKHQPYVGDVPNGGYTTSKSDSGVVSEEYLEFLKKKYPEVYSEGYLDYLTRLK